MRRSRLSQYKQNKLIELFIAGVTARTAAQLVGVNKNTAAYAVAVQLAKSLYSGF